MRSDMDYAVTLSFVVRVESRLKQTWRGGGMHWKEGEGDES